MSIHVSFTDDPARVLADAGEFLASDPVLHNIIFTLLQERVAHPQPGRYWVAMKRGAAAGVALHSPASFAATVTPMEPDVVNAVVDAIARTDVTLPGVHGEAGTAARFAGSWTERTRSTAVPFQGQRIYEVTDVVYPGSGRAAASGTLRRATRDDRDLVIAWMRGFWQDIGEPVADPSPSVDRQTAAGKIWLWDDGEPMSLAAESQPAASVVRVRAVYTPSERRDRGYAAACVASLSRRIREDGHRCMLYTGLGNPISNPVFRQLGYRSVAEVLRYRFV